MHSTSLHPIELDTVGFQRGMHCDWHPSSTLLPAQYLADTTVADPQLSGDVAGTHTLVGQLHDPLPHHVWQGSSVHKHPAQLVHPPVPYVGHNSTKKRHQNLTLRKACVYAWSEHLSRRDPLGGSF